RSGCRGRLPADCWRGPHPSDRCVGHGATPGTARQTGGGEGPAAGARGRAARPARRQGSGTTAGPGRPRLCGATCPTTRRRAQPPAPQGAKPEDQPPVAEGAAPRERLDQFLANARVQVAHIDQIADPVLARVFPGTTVFAVRLANPAPAPFKVRNVVIVPDQG